MGEVWKARDTVWIDQARAMQHRPVLDGKGRQTGVFRYQGQVANRALELIGKELGMFVDRSEQLVWDGDPAKLTDGQLETLLQKFGAQRAALETQPAPPTS